MSVYFLSFFYLSVVLIFVIVCLYVSFSLSICIFKSVYMYLLVYLYVSQFVGLYILYIYFCLSIKSVCLSAFLVLKGEQKIRLPPQKRS